MRGLLGQSVIVENVGGGDGTIGIGRVARARPDGYTVVIGTRSTQVLNGALYALAYDVVNDFLPISPFARIPTMLFGRQPLAKDLDELIAWLNANPDRASAGFGASSAHLTAALFKKETRIARG